MQRSIYIGFDPREAAACAVARKSIQGRLSASVPIHSLVLDDLRKAGLYWRPTERRDGRLWDAISEAPMSTEFAISRFLVPHLASAGWALFMDGDMLARADLSELFASSDPRFAVLCVKHDHRPASGMKKDAQVQTVYSRKNWSSLVLFNCEHPANRKLTVELVNSVPGRDLHRFCWLTDGEIGELGPEWNYLVGHTALPAGVEPKIVHFTDGTPDLPGYENAEYANEWWRHNDDEDSPRAGAVPPLALGMSSMSR